MKCATITAKNLDGKYECLYCGSDVSEAKKLFKDLRVNKKNDYCGIWMFYMPQGRVFSKAGFISEAEAKEAAKVKRSKKQAVEKAVEAKKEADAKAEADKVAEAKRLQEAETKAGGRAALEREGLAAKAKAKESKAEAPKKETKKKK